MYVNGEWFWALGERERDEAYILADVHCLVCGESVEGESFIQWYFHGPQLDLAGMHTRCAHTMCVGMLKDLAEAGVLRENTLQRMLTGCELPSRQAQHPSNEGDHE